MSAHPKMNERKKIWIHRETDGSNDLRVCAIWGGGVSVPLSFSKADSEELFACIRDAIQAKYPNVTVNPWSDARPGTLD